MKRILIAIATLSLAACGIVTGEEHGPTQGQAQGEAEVATAESAPVPCRPDGVEAAELSIGPLDIAPGSLEVEAKLNEVDGQPVLFFSFDEATAAALGRVTRDLVGQPLPVVVDGETIFSPIVREAILGGQMQLTGQFDGSELEDLAQRLSPPCEGAG